LVSFGQPTALEESGYLAGFVPHPSIGPALVPKPRLEQKSVTRPVLLGSLIKEFDKGLTYRIAVSIVGSHGHVLVVDDSLMSPRFA
jgi:hypothetical protein